MNELRFLAQMRLAVGLLPYCQGYPAEYELKCVYGGPKHRIQFIIKYDPVSKVIYYIREDKSNENIYPIIGGMEADDTASFLEDCNDISDILDKATATAEVKTMQERIARGI